MQAFLDATSQWLNKTQMTAFRAFILAGVTAVVITLFSITSVILLLDNASAAAALNRDPVIRAAAQTTESAHHNAGKEIATLIFGFLTAAIITNAASQFGDRSTSKELHEAKERGKATGAVAAASVAQSVEQIKSNGVTKEYPVPLTQ